MFPYLLNGITATPFSPDFLTCCSVWSRIHGKTQFLSWFTTRALTNRAPGGDVPAKLKLLLFLWWYSAWRKRILNKGMDELERLFADLRRPAKKRGRLSVLDHWFYNLCFTRQFQLPGNCVHYTIMFIFPKCYFFFHFPNECWGHKCLLILTMM